MQLNIRRILFEAKRKFLFCMIRPSFLKRKEKVHLVIKLIIVSVMSCISGNPSRYQSRGVIRMNRNDSKPFEDQRLGVPGSGTESEADQHLRGMVKNQLETNVTLER